MDSIANRISQLRTKMGLSSIALSQRMGLARSSIDRFESGKQTPTKEQQQALADFFGVSIAYLRAETNDPTRQDSWMDMIIEAHNEEPPVETVQAPRRKKADQTEESEGNLLDALLMSSAAKQALKKLILDVLRSDEGQETLRKTVRDELRKKQ